MKHNLRDAKGRFSKKVFRTLKSSNIFIGCGAEAQATGCVSAGSYADFAMAKGFEYIEVLDWSSSAGDWQFIVSKDGFSWQILTQENNYPRPGFSHYLDTDIWYGTAKEALQQINEVAGG